MEVMMSDGPTGPCRLCYFWEETTLDGLYRNLCSVHLKIQHPESTCDWFKYRHYMGPSRQGAPYATKADSGRECGHPACALYGRCMTGDCQLRGRTLADSDGDDGA